MQPLASNGSHRSARSCQTNAKFPKTRCIGFRLVIFYNAWPFPAQFFKMQHCASSCHLHSAFDSNTSPDCAIYMKYPKRLRRIFRSTLGSRPSALPNINVYVSCCFTIAHASNHLLLASREPAHTSLVKCLSPQNAIRAYHSPHCAQWLTDEYVFFLGFKANAYAQCLQRMPCCQGQS